MAQGLEALALLLVRLTLIMPHGLQLSRPCVSVVPGQYLLKALPGLFLHSPAPGFQAFPLSPRHSS